GNIGFAALTIGGRPQLVRVSPTTGGTPVGMIGDGSVGIRGLAIAVPAPHASVTANQRAGRDGDFVSGLYHDLLSRTVDNDGLSFFLLPIANARNALLVPMAMAFVTSGEYRSHLISDDYSKFLGRAASTGEAAFWSSQLERGRTV